jgi:hypothetical protein
MKKAQITGLSAWQSIKTCLKSSRCGTPVSLFTQKVQRWSINVPALRYLVAFRAPTAVELL